MPLPVLDMIGKQPREKPGGRGMVMGKYSVKVGSGIKNYAECYNLDTFEAAERGNAMKKPNEPGVSVLADCNGGGRELRISATLRTS